MLPISEYEEARKRVMALEQCRAPELTTHREDNPPGITVSQRESEELHPIS